jgi:hypothetical protein
MLWVAPSRGVALGQPRPKAKLVRTSLRVLFKRRQSLLARGSDSKPRL